MTAGSIPASSPGRWDYRLVLVLGVVTALAYAWFLTTHGVSYASGSDASGYLNSARLLEGGQAGCAVKKIAGLDPPTWDFTFQQPLGFVSSGDDGRLLPTYPLGMPLQYWTAAQIVGWNHAAILVNVFSALMVGVLIVRIGRKYLNLQWPWLFVTVLFTWFSPLFVYFALQPMSDVPATAWTLLALFAAAESTRRWSWGLVTGVAVGMAVLVRPTNLLVLSPIIVILGCNWRAWLVMIAAGMPFAATLAVYNLAVYGHVLTTGYGDVSGLLQLKFVPHNLAHFAHWIPVLQTPFVLMALGLPWLLRKNRRFWWPVIIWVLLIIGFYAFYYHSGETWWYLRFILPVFPLLLLAAAQTSQSLLEKWNQPIGRGVVLALVLIVGANSLLHLNRKLDVMAIQRADRAYFDAMQWLKTHAPSNAVMTAMQASGALHFYTQFPLLRYDLMTADQFHHAIEVARGNGQPIYAPLFPFELKQVVKSQLGGKWEKVATVDYITIWQLQP